jgi:ribose transport system permease protein
MNGTLVAYVRASAVIATLGMTTILTGTVLYLSSGRPPGSVPDGLRVISNARVDTVPVPVIVWAIMDVFVAILLRKLIFGRFVAAVGSNPRAAHLSGLPVPRIVMTSHMISGFLAAVGGVLFTAALGVGSVNFGPDIMMNSVAATILGGVSFGSGRGGVMGPCVGVLSFGLLFPVLTIFGIQEPVKLLIQGVVIASAAAIYGLKTR